MKIEMDDNAASTVQACAMWGTIVLIAYFVTVVWWSGLNDGKRDLALAQEANTSAKIAACSVEYGWSDYHKQQFITYEYCGGKDD